MAVKSQQFLLCNTRYLLSSSSLEDLSCRMADPVASVTSLASSVRLKPPIMLYIGLLSSRAEQSRAKQDRATAFDFLRTCIVENCLSLAAQQRN